MRDEGLLMMWRVFLAIALAAAAMPAISQGTKVGFVNSVRLESEAVPFVRAAEALKLEFAPRTAQIAELQKQIAAEKERFEKERAKLSPSDLQARGIALTAMMRKSDQMVESITEDFERRKAERAAKLLEEVNVAIKAVAEAGKFDLILQQVTYAGPGIDITEQVMKELAKRAGK
jgi:outer membrane protein